MIVVWKVVVSSNKQTVKSFLLYYQLYIENGVVIVCTILQSTTAQTRVLQ